ncbi:MAG: ribonuclease HII [Microbacterium sp.]
MSAWPTLDLERRLLADAPLIVACDEVGRGALAGPVAVGASVIDARIARGSVPEGLRDSKLISERRRPAMAERAAEWVGAGSVGWASPEEVDDAGIMAALGRAALRAIAGLAVQGIEPASGVVLLDGNHDYISVVARGDAAWAGLGRLDVRTVVKGDRDCASIAAASVAAKVARDEHMVGLHAGSPAYAWDRNKGYASPAHRAAIASHGLSAHHRRSWAISDAPALF